MRRLSPVSEFAIRSLLFAVLMVITLGLTVTLVVRQIYLQQAANTAQIAASALVAHHVQRSEVEAGYISKATKLELDSIMHDDLANSDIVAVKLWGANGTLLYSSTGDGESRSFENHPELARALRGEFVKSVADVSRGENAEEFSRYGRLLSVYAPLRFSGDRRVMGAFEVYEAFGPVMSSANRLLIGLWAIIIIGSLLTYGAQVSIVKRASDELDVARGELEELDDRLRASFEDLEMHSLGTLQALVAAVDAKDSYTARHSITVTDYAVAIGRRLGLSSNELIALERAGLLHDVGKIGTPEAILLKPSHLDDEEFRTIKEHAEMGGHIIEAIPFLSGIVPIVRWHHERWDGTGYPDGLQGSTIPVLARILAVADAFDAMTSDRPYRSAMPLESARAEMLRFRGAQFDPHVVDALFHVLDADEFATVGVSAASAAASA